MTNTACLYDLTPQVSTCNPTISHRIRGSELQSFFLVFNLKYVDFLSLDFLVITRNVFEMIRPNGCDYWTAELVDRYPLESDELAIEYLSQHEYDIEKAFFHMSVDMGCGKDDYMSSLSHAWMDKTSLMLHFTEFRDRYLRYDGKYYGNMNPDISSLRPFVLDTSRYENHLADCDPSLSEECQLDRALKGGAVNFEDSSVDENGGSINKEGDSYVEVKTENSINRPQRIGERDRQDTKKKWQDIQHRLSDFNGNHTSKSSSSSTSGSTNSVSSNLTASNGSSCTPSSSSSSSILSSSSMTSVSMLLENAMKLPSNQMEDNLGENSLRSLLGDTVKVRISAS